MICPNCKNEVPDGLNRCILCGSDLSVEIVKKKPVKKTEVLRGKKDEIKIVNNEGGKNTSKKRAKLILPAIVIIAGCICLSIMYSNHFSKEIGYKPENDGSVKEKEPAITLESDADSFQLKVGESKIITLNASGEDLPDNYYLNVPQECSFIDWEWGEFDGDSISVTITGLYCGKETVNVTLTEDEYDETVLADSIVDVSVVLDEAHYIESSVDSLNLSVGESKEITISADGTDMPESYTFSFSIDTTIYEGDWGDWVSDNASVITIKGLAEGEGRVEFSLIDCDNEEKIAYAYVDIVVE